MTDSPILLLKHWRTNCSRSQIANYKAGNLASQWNYLLGVPTVILSATVGTSVFAALGNKVDASVQIAVGAISVLAAALAALQTFLKFGERSQKFKSTAAEYGAVKRQIDQLLSNPNEINPSVLDRVRERMDTLAKEGPEIPQRIWSHAMVVRPTAGKHVDA